jgi:hypothetical protein
MLVFAVQVKQTLEGQIIYAYLLRYPSIGKIRLNSSTY